MTLELTSEPYDAPDATYLVTAVQAEYVERYGAPDEAVVDPEEFVPPVGLFLVGRVGGQPVASGAFRRDADVAELKRMYVVPEHRGRGHARAVLAALEEAARAAGCTRVRLVTGIRQPEAMALYASSGYAETAPFGHYEAAASARFYGKELGPPEGVSSPG